MNPKKIVFIIALIIIAIVVGYSINTNKSSNEPATVKTLPLTETLITKDEALKLVQNEPRVKDWAATHKAIYDVTEDGDWYAVVISEYKDGYKTTYDLYFVDMKTGEMSRNVDVGDE